MKRKIFSKLLMVAMLVASVSMFVSCKDYDDDINNVSDRVTVLEAAKVDLENKIATLRADLEANYATKVALADSLISRYLAVIEDITILLVFRGRSCCNVGI